MRRSSCHSEERKPTTVRLSDEMIERVDQRAARERRSRNAQIEVMLLESLERADQAQPEARRAE
jgi:hypothetical protein